MDSEELKCRDLLNIGPTNRDWARNATTEVCYLDMNIKTGNINPPFRISIYDKRDYFAFRIINFRHMDSNIPANLTYGVYISQLVRYARICMCKVDLKNRLR